MKKNRFSRVIRFPSSHRAKISGLTLCSEWTWQMLIIGSACHRTGQMNKHKLMTKRRFYTGISGFLYHTEQKVFRLTFSSEGTWQMLIIGSACHRDRRPNVGFLRAAPVFPTSTTKKTQKMCFASDQLKFQNNCHL